MERINCNSLLNKFIGMPLTLALVLTVANTIAKVAGLSLLVLLLAIVIHDCARGHTKPLWKSIGWE